MLIIIASMEADIRRISEKAQFGVTT
jgi:hypothetical protein